MSGHNITVSISRKRRDSRVLIDDLDISDMVRDIQVTSQGGIPRVFLSLMPESVNHAAHAEPIDDYEPPVGGAR